MELTREQYQRLKPLEQHLIRAVKGNYVFNMLLTEAKELFEIYNELFQKNEKSYGCTRCRLNIAKALGTKYFEYKGKEEEKRIKNKSNRNDGDKKTKTKTNRGEQRTDRRTTKEPKIN